MGWNLRQPSLKRTAAERLTGAVNERALTCDEASPSTSLTWGPAGAQTPEKRRNRVLSCVRTEQELLQQTRAVLCAGSRCEEEAVLMRALHERTGTPASS